MTVETRETVKTVETGVTVETKVTVQTSNMRGRIDSSSRDWSDRRDIID